MVEKIPQQKNAPCKSISDIESSDEETDPRLHTSPKERTYGTIIGSATATKIALTHTTMKTNPTVERGPAHTPRIKPLPKQKATDQTTQTDIKEKSK